MTCESVVVVVKFHHRGRAVCLRYIGNSILVDLTRVTIKYLYERAVSTPRVHTTEPKITRCNCIMVNPIKL
jgi:hypothetical protein